jgi:hypothetical protein
MRIALSLIVSFLCFFPLSADASPLELEFLNSKLTFGGANAYDRGWDGSVWHDGYWDPDFRLGFEATPTTLVSQVLRTDSGGGVVQSNYTYAGGTFHFDGLGADLPITLFKVFAPEPTQQLIEHGPLFGGDVYFELGPGLLDPGVASALGIGRRIQGGFASTDMAYGECGSLGDHNSASRVACDGATYITLEVPEPALLVIFATGVAPVVARRVRRRG